MTRTTWPPGLTDSEIEDLEERAAILEYDAGLARPAAERLALQLLEQRRELLRVNPKSQQKGS